MNTIHVLRRLVFSLAPGFSPVLTSIEFENRFNGFPSALKKPLKRFSNPDNPCTGLKPGVNETGIVVPLTTPRPITEQKRCRASLATAVQTAVVLATLLLNAGAFAQAAVESNPAVRFRAVDVFVDSKGAPLAAYQIEFTVTNGNARIVGIEGGGNPAFAKPPYYDPKAMQQDRAIIAAFSASATETLPKEKTRVATIHLQTTGTEELKFDLKLQAAADAGGNKIQAEANAEERKSL